MRSPRTPRSLLWLTFLESFGTVLIERSLYFFTHDVLGFGETDNLWFALAFGVTYVIGALASHPAANHMGERRLLFASLGGLFVMHALLTAWPRAGLLVVAFPIIGFLQGIKWPVVESYVSAGRTPTELVRLLSRYNATWALSVPLALASSGPLIALWPASLFAAAGVLNVVAGLCGLSLARRPLHLDVSHPERPNSAEVLRLGSLLATARWAMLGSYALLFLLAPLMPGLFAKLGVSLNVATSAAGLLDLARLGTFVLLGTWVRWRGEAWPLVAALFALPASFAMVLFGTNLLFVLAGELLFGAAAGLAYTAALYYALVVKNASVDAGGAHEGLIGLGFALGPLAGLIAHGSQNLLGGYVTAMVLSTAPLMVVCTVFGLRPLRTAPRRASNSV